MEEVRSRRYYDPPGKKYIKFSVSERSIILKLHVLLTCFCDLKNSTFACVSLSFLGDKFELDGGY